MPGKNLSGGGSFYRQGGKMTRGVSGHHQRNGSTGSENSNSSKNKENHAVREAHRNRIKLDSYLADDENFPSFKAQLAQMGLELRDIQADGNCLFRALGDQLEGHCRNHFRHRASVVNFMKDNREDFEPFLEDNVTFDHHTSHLQKLGTHAGNDAIVAFARLHSSIVVIHQLNGKPLMIQGPATVSDLTRQLHLAYHNGDHYSSVRREGDNTETPAHIRIEDALKMESKYPQKQQQQHHQRHGVSQGFQGGMVSARRGLEDIEHEVILATNCNNIEQVRESLMESDYDVDLAIADILQQLELANGAEGDSSSVASKDNSSDSGICPNSPTLSSNTVTSNGDINDKNNNPANGNTDRSTGGVLKTSNSPSTNGKGHKVHFREDSYGGSSGYGSMSSNKGAKPKQVSERKSKEMKKQEKKRRAEEARRQKHLQSLQGHNGVPHHPHVRDVTVVALQDGKLTRI